MEPLALAELVSEFQEQCAQAIWDNDGIVNKQMGDGMMAIFNFPIRSEHHTSRALHAARSIQHRPGLSDFTAIGGVVNRAARLESQAGPGQIDLTAEAAEQVPDLGSEAQPRELCLKGFNDGPMESACCSG